jgi:hypothetical protein
MSQEDRPEVQTAASTSAEELTTPARPWATSKRVAPVLLRVLVTNKSETDDVKVWYRLATKNLAGANVHMPLSSRKAHVSARANRVIEDFVKIDPTKDFFFSDHADIEVELQATVKDQEEPTAGRARYAKRVHYPPHDMGVGAGSAEDDDDEREDDEYDGYAGNAVNTGYDAGEQDNAAAEQLLHINQVIRPQASPGPDGGDRRSNGSTDAVLGNGGDADDGHSQDGLGDPQDGDAVDVDLI